MSRTIVVIFSCFIVLQACQHQKKTATPVKTTTNIEFKDTLTISFLSRGEGPDRQAVPEFKTYQENTTKRLGKNIFSSPKTWGREGEHNIHVIFTGLSRVEQERITKEMADFDTKYDLVLIKVFVKNP